MIGHRYDKEQGPAPRFEISNDLTKLTKLFIISALTYFINSRISCFQ